MCNTNDDSMRPESSPAFFSYTCDDEQSIQLPTYKVCSLGKIASIMCE